MKTKARVILLGQGEGIMKTKARIILLGLVIAIAFCYVTSVRAESNFASGGDAQSGGAGAPASLDFQIVIPEFIYFRVGTAGGGNIDTITFSPTATDVYTGGGTTAGTGGDATGGAVNVVLISNIGDVEIIESNGGGLTNADGHTISYGQINTTVVGSIVAPSLTDAGGSTELIPANLFGIINLTSVWTYEYTNPATPPAAGTYTDQVTYTAAHP